jgi:hypothetical protein
MHRQPENLSSSGDFPINPRNHWREGIETLCDCQTQWASGGGNREDCSQRPSLQKVRPYMKRSLKARRVEGIAQVVGRLHSKCPAKTKNKASLSVLQETEKILKSSLSNHLCFLTRKPRPSVMSGHDVTGIWSPPPPIHDDLHCGK